jgi:hypothetical protein
MTPYEKVFNQQADIDNLVAEARTLREQAQAYYTELFEAAQRAAKKALKTRKRGTVPLPEEQIESMRQAVFNRFPRAEGIYDEITKVREARKDTLNKLADKTKLSPKKGQPLQRVKSSSTYEFSSQTQPGFYALARLRPLAWKLAQLGFQHECRTVRKEYGTDYELWSDAELWQADCADRQVTIKEALNAIGRTVNPMVVFSNFFPYEWADRHYAESGPGFQIRMAESTNEPISIAT